MMLRKSVFSLSLTLVLVSAAAIGFADELKEAPPRPFTDSMKDNVTFVIDASEAAGSGADLVFPYIENKIYRTYGQIGHVTDICLEPGENVVYMGGGDTARWNVDTSKSGSPGGEVTHIYIKPLMSGIIGDFVINTDRRVYRLMMVTGGYYNPCVRWNYSSKGVNSVGNVFMSSNTSTVNAGQPKNYARINPAQLDFGFVIKGKDVPWKPEKVFRSEDKTYIQMKPEVTHTDLPAFFVVSNDDKLRLVNYRFQNNCFVIDYIFDKGVLVMGKEGKITIEYKYPKKR